MKSIKVLVVGETARFFLYLLQWLDRRGCRCQFAPSYRDACDLMSRTQFDLVLSQYELRDRTAFPLLDRLVGSSATVFFCARVEDGSLWFKMLERGKRCVGAPVLRSNDLTQALSRVLEDAVEPHKTEAVASGVDSKSFSTHSSLYSNPN